MTAKALKELAQFMAASKITNFISCKRYDRVKKAAKYMAKKYQKFLERNPDECGKLSLMKSKKYLAFKISFIHTTAESL